MYNETPLKKTKNSKKNPNIIRLPIPDSMKQYLVFAAAMQNFELIPPTELAMNIHAYILEKRSSHCLEIDKLAKLRAYINRWKITDFTQGGSV